MDTATFEKFSSLLAHKLDEILSRKTTIVKELSGSFFFSSSPYSISIVSPSNGEKFQFYFVFFSSIFSKEKKTRTFQNSIRINVEAKLKKGSTLEKFSRDMYLRRRCMKDSNSCSYITRIFCT